MPATSTTDDLVITERAALVAFWLAQGARWSTQQVAERTGLTRQGALRLMNTMARVVPIVLNDGAWQEMPPD